MALSNTEIAGFFNKLADLLEIEAGEPLDELPGVGSAIAEKIRTIVASGRLPAWTRPPKPRPSP